MKACTGFELLLVLSVLGCAAVDPKADYERVARTIEEATGQSGVFCPGSDQTIAPCVDASLGQVVSATGSGGDVGKLHCVAVRLAEDDVAPAGGAGTWRTDDEISEAVAVHVAGAGDAPARLVSPGCHGTELSSSVLRDPSSRKCSSPASVMSVAERVRN